MLLSKSYDIEKILDLRFVHDDGSVNAAKLQVGDLATIAFNNSGMRDEITGKITRIEAGTHYEIPKPMHVCQPGLVDSCNKNTWYIVVDGSMWNDSSIKKIFVNNIVGCEVLKRNDSVTAVQSPLGNTNITDIRVNGNVFEISMNHSDWIQVCKIPDCPIIVDPELEDLVNKILATIPGCVSPADKEKMVRQILASMEEEGQIVINKTNCDCGCNTPSTPDDKPTESIPSTPITGPAQLNIDAIAAAVVGVLKEQGLLVSPPPTENEGNTGSAEPDIPEIGGEVDTE